MKDEDVYAGKPDLSDDLRTMADNLFPGISNSLRRAFLYSAAKEIETLRSGYFVPPIVGNGQPRPILIAAAPDLLEALETIRSGLRNLPASATAVKLDEIAAVAIAKAEPPPPMPYMRDAAMRNEPPPENAESSTEGE